MWRYFLFADDDKENIAHILAALSAGLSGADIESIGLTARRHAVIDKRPVDIGTVASAIVSSHAGKAALPQRQPLDSEQKKSAATVLKEKFELSNADIGRLLNITRQGVRSYFLHDDGDA
jgi:hypothetical protein